MSSGVNKLSAERNQRTLLELVSQPGNDVCADCKARNPRWASHNLGIFVCVGCASIHRKIGTHISKVKSLTLDSWTKEQVDRMKEMGNLKSNAIYNPNEVRHPPPPTLEDPTRDSELEAYIRSKYEYRRFLDKSALVASKLGPSRSASSANALAPKPSAQRRNLTPSPAPKTATDIAATMFSTAKPQLQPRTAPSQPAAQASSGVPEAQPLRSASQPIPVKKNNQQSSTATKPEGVWADLISLQEPATNASLPLQYQSNNGGYSTLPMNNGTSSALPNMLGSGTQFGNANGSPMGNAPANSFLQQQQSLMPNSFAHQQFPSQSFMSPFPATTATFQPNTSHIPQSFTQPGSFFQNQPQPQIATPFYQPQPQPLLTSPQQSAHPHFLSSSPNAQFIPSHSPQPQSTTPNSLPFNSNINNSLGMGMGYMGHSPQSMMNGIGGGSPAQTQVPAMSMQQNGHFGPGFAQQPMGNPYGQIQFTHGAFPGQTTQWGPM